MKKATLVLATAVAFLLSGPVFAARKVVDMPSTGSILSGSASPIAENGILKGSLALEGEYIPGVKNALAVQAETKIASSAISGLAKNVIKGGVAGLVIGATFDALLDGVDWVIKDGQVVKQTQGGIAPTSSSSGEYVWTVSISQVYTSSDPGSACAAYFAAGNTQITSGYFSSDTQYVCGGRGSASAYRTGDHCPSNTTYSRTVGACLSASGTSPLTTSDYDTLDGFVQGKDGVWQRDLTTELCAHDESCYKALNPDTSLTGPSTVTGTPQTVTTTNSDGSQSVSVKTPTSTVTYGPNYYDYTTTTTTTTNNGGDTTTTTDDTDTSFPVPPDIFGGANDGIGGIPDAITGTTSSTSPIPYMPWWSFSQSCSEITFTIPVYGVVTTALCPIYEHYIWPVLYFFFAVFTWLHCWGIWRGTLLRVRAF